MRFEHLRELQLILRKKQNKSQMEKNILNDLEQLLSVEKTMVTVEKSTLPSGQPSLKSLVVTPSVCPVCGKKW